MENPRMIHASLLASLYGIITMALASVFWPGITSFWLGLFVSVLVYFQVSHRKKKSVQKPNNTSIQKGFTLVELLVVLAVIALLAGLLFPAINKARAKGWQSRCLSNLHQLGIAVELYAQEYRHYLPVAAMQPSINTNLTPLSILLGPYVAGNQSKIFECPADRKPSDAGQTFFALEGSSFSWNSLLNGRFIDRTQISIATLQLWPPIMGDYEHFHGGTESGRNYLYADGRVEQDLKSLIQ